MNNQDFLNPKSMLTPGIAGGTVMLITNALINQFDLSGPKVALGLSFLVGSLVFLTKIVPIWQRLIYYVLNSLIIFAMATGTAFVGHKAEAKVTNARATADTTMFTAPSRISTNAAFTNEWIVSMDSTNVALAAFRLNNTSHSPTGFFKQW